MIRADQGIKKAASKLLHKAGEAASTAAEQTQQGFGVGKWVAIIGAGALLVGGGIFAYNSLHQEEEAFNADGEEFAQVCQDTNTGLRVDDSECEKAGVAADASPSTGSSSGSGGSGSGSGTHHNSGNHNAFLWYYLGRSSAGTSNVPSIGSSLKGGTTSRPHSGTVYSGVPRQGGGFEHSYRNAKRTSTVSGGSVTSTTNGGKTTSRSNYGSRNGTGGSKSGSRGGFGGGSKSGGGTSGG